MTDKEAEAFAGFYLMGLCMLFVGIWLAWDLGYAFLISGALLLVTVIAGSVIDDWFGAA